MGNSTDRIMEQYFQVFRTLVVII